MRFKGLVNLSIAKNDRFVYMLRPFKHFKDGHKNYNQMIFIEIDKIRKT